MRRSRLACLARGCRLAGLACLLLPLALAGCGARTGTVTGKITYNGQALGNGRVMFIPDKDPGKARDSTIAADGTYTVVNVPTGPVTITVETYPTSESNTPVGVKGADTLKPPSNMPMPKAEGAGGGPGKYVKIPDKYKAKESSGLTYDVKPGKQEHDIPLS